MKIIGLCGGSGSGKGAASVFFIDLGIPVIDTDGIYREITSHDSACLRQLSARFGHDIIGENGALNRSMLRSLVFDAVDAERNREDLNAITHKHILDRVREIILELRSCGHRFVVVDAPLLFESGYADECDCIISVIAPMKERVSRIMSRDGINEDAAKRRIAAQLSDEYIIERSDIIIVNDGSLDDLKSKVGKIAKEIFV